jgi:hypothetical protein
VFVNNRFPCAFRRLPANVIRLVLCLPARNQRQYSTDGDHCPDSAFIHSFIHSIAHLFTHSFIYSVSATNYEQLNGLRARRTFAVVAVATPTIGTKLRKPPAAVPPKANDNKPATELGNFWGPTDRRRISSQPQQFAENYVERVPVMPPRLVNSRHATTID